MKIYWFITMQPLRQDNTVGTFAPFHTSIIYDMGGRGQSYIYQVLQTIQMKLILLCVWADPAVLGSAKTALKFIYKI